MPGVSGALRADFFLTAAGEGDLRSRLLRGGETGLEIPSWKGGEAADDGGVDGEKGDVGEGVVRLSDISVMLIRGGDGMFTMVWDVLVTGVIGPFSSTLCKYKYQTHNCAQK